MTIKTEEMKLWRRPASSTDSYSRASFQNLIYTDMHGLEPATGEIASTRPDLEFKQRNPTITS